jgi:hypothetical protein
MTTTIRVLPHPPLLPNRRSAFSETFAREKRASVDRRLHASLQL